jgi:outer membrane protein assembly factor BamB
MAVIELGLVTSHGDEPPAEPVRQPLGRAELRRVLVALVAICCVLTVTGSARPNPHGLTQLWSIPYSPEVDGYRLVGDTLYILGQSGERRLTARDIRTGAVRWSTTAVADASWMTTVEAGVLLMPTSISMISRQDPDGTGYSREVSRDTVAIDTATGRRLWQKPGEFTAALGDRVLLAEWNETGEQARLMRMVRLRDGGTIWSRDRGDLASWTTDTTPGARPDRLVTVTAQGRAEVLALADGSVVTTGTLPWPAAMRNNDHSAVTVQGHRLYLDQSIRDKATVTAYDTDTLRPLWTVKQTSSGGSFGCGPVVCILDGESTSGHDRATGARLWRLSGATGTYPLTNGQLLIDEDNGARRALMDPATGRHLADLGTGMPVWDSLGRATLYLVAPTTQPPGRTAVSSFDPATGEVILLGALPQTLDFGCQYEADLLVCPTQDKRLLVTDVG